MALSSEGHTICPVKDQGRRQECRFLFSYVHILWILPQPSGGKGISTVGNTAQHLRINTKEKLSVLLNYRYEKNKMDKIYPPEKFPCSEHIPLKNLFAYFSELSILHSDPNFDTMEPKQEDEILLNMLKIQGNKERKQLLEDISIDLLAVEGEISIPDVSISTNKPEIRIKEPCKISKKARELDTVKMRESYQSKLQYIYIKHKYSKEPYICQARSDENKEGDIEPGSEFAVAVRIYHPFEFNYSNTNSRENMKFSHEIVVLGSNTLAHLRDKIICHSDSGLCVELEDPPKQTGPADAKEKYPSGFIFIDNIFYNDNRHPRCLDNSEVIRHWAAEKGIGPLQTASLEETRINELSPRFGYPYVYQHQGKCEHILTFSDAWLLSGKDSLNVKDYPSYTGIHRFYSKHCTLCYAQEAKWICADCDRLPHDKTFLCHECFLSYNYKDGKRIGNFKAYPFYDRSVM